MMMLSSSPQLALLQPPLAIFQRPGISEVGGAFVGDHYLFAAASENKLTLWSFR
jgi:hypothetical protein